MYKRQALLYNIRPQAMARLGLSYEAVAARNPRIVYLGAYGFGEEMCIRDRCWPSASPSMSG